MNIVLISSTPPPMGGISKWTARMLKAELPGGWKISLVSDKIIGERDVFGDDQKYKLKNEIKRWSKVWYTLFKAIRNRDTVIAHACPIATVPSMFVNIISGIIVRACRRRFLIHFRCTVPNLVKTKKQKVLLKILCKLSNHIIVLNSQTKVFLSNSCDRKISLIPNFFDFKEDGNPVKVISRSIARVLYVGGVIAEKGCDDIIKVAQNFPMVEFRLVGDASTEIRNQAYLLPNVILTGVMEGPALKEEFLKADVFMFLSRYPGEGFSNSLTEAMAYGLPCIVTNWAANADQIENGKGGYVVEGNVISSTIDALEKMQNSIVRESQSKYNYNKAKTQYSSQNIIEQYVSCYNSLVK